MTDWAVGDRALCVDDGPCQCGFCKKLASGLSAGRIYIVARVCPVDLTNDPGRTWVALEVGLPAAPEHLEPGFSVERFRKIRPDEHEGNAEDWALLLETAKPKQLEPISKGKKPVVNNGD